jgi:hypothetical protein
VFFPCAHENSCLLEERILAEVVAARQVLHELGLVPLGAALRYGHSALADYEQSVTFGELSYDELFVGVDDLDTAGGTLESDSIGSLSMSLTSSIRSISLVRMSSRRLLKFGMLDKQGKVSLNQRQAKCEKSLLFQQLHVLVLLFDARAHHDGLEHVSVDGPQLAVA